MDEVDKMRSSQLANTASPEIQERFKRAKKLLLKLIGRIDTRYSSFCHYLPAFLLRSW